MALANLPASASFEWTADDLTYTGASPFTEAPGIYYEAVVIDSSDAFLYNEVRAQRLGGTALGGFGETTSETRVLLVWPCLTAPFARRTRLLRPPIQRNLAGFEVDMA